MEYKTNKKENVYFAIKIVATVLVLYWLVAVFKAVSSAGSSAGSALVLFGTYAVMIWLFVVFQKVFLVAYLKGDGVEVTERQFGDFYAEYARMAETLGVKRLPKLFLVQRGGMLNAFAVRFSGKNYIAVFSDVFALLKDDPAAVRFVVAHELGHVRRAHMQKRFWTFPSSVVPFLTAAYSRACEYTCDGVGMALAPDTPVNGLVLLAAGPALYREVSVPEYVESARKNRSAVVRFAGLFMGHPWLPLRVENLTAHSPSARPSSSSASERP
jgi:Zn-dependent protease with chaperone function